MPEIKTAKMMKVMKKKESSRAMMMRQMKEMHNKIVRVDEQKIFVGHKQDQEINRVTRNKVMSTESKSLLQHEQED